MSCYPDELIHYKKIVRLIQGNNKNLNEQYLVIVTNDANGWYYFELTNSREE